MCRKINDLRASTFLFSVICDRTSNVVRWSNTAYDRLWQQAKTELDSVKRAALFIRMNDLVIEDVAIIPVVWRHDVSAVSHSLRGLESGPWDLELWNLAYWYREP